LILSALFDNLKQLKQLLKRCPVLPKSALFKIFLTINSTIRRYLMGWFIKFIDSSIGKKLVMALTGLFLSLFLIIHLAGNLLLLRNDDGAAFLTYSRIMASPDNIIIRIIEYGLFILLIYHIINGIRLWIINKRSRGQAYESYNPSANSSFFSRTMILSGSIIFIFLVIHLRTFFFPYRFSSGSHEHEMYLGVQEAFSSPYYSGFYVIALILLAFILFMEYRVRFRHSA
jgi:succinate dehydrogenase / fumarate reductase, cytochrome b subunit